jgi:hypothetical protein
MKVMIVDKNIHRTEKKEKERGRKNPPQIKEERLGPGKVREVDDNGEDRCPMKPWPVQIKDDHRKDSDHDGGRAPYELGNKSPPRP